MSASVPYEELLGQAVLNLGFGGIAFYMMYKFATNTLEKVRDAIERNTEVLVRLDAKMQSVR